MNQPRRLDVTIQSQILAEMQKLPNSVDGADLGQPRPHCPLRARRRHRRPCTPAALPRAVLVEEVLNQPAHPYTRGLMERSSRNVPGQRIRQIPGNTQPAQFGPRLRISRQMLRGDEDCTVDPPPMTLRPAHPEMLPPQL